MTLTLSLLILHMGSKFPLNRQFFPLQLICRSVKLVKTSLEVSVGWKIYRVNNIPHHPTTPCNMTSIASSFYVIHIIKVLDKCFQAVCVGVCMFRQCEVLKVEGMILIMGWRRRRRRGGQLSNS